jgi:hypothetical protein
VGEKVRKTPKKKRKIMKAEKGVESGVRVNRGWIEIEDFVRSKSNFLSF